MPRAATSGRAIPSRMTPAHLTTIIDEVYQDVDDEIIFVVMSMTIKWIKFEI